MLNKIRVSNLEINLDNLAYNIRILREYIDKKVLIMAVVKANAYGHGAVHSSKIFLENGADRLGVSILSEGIELRKLGTKKDILVLGYTSPRQYPLLLEYDISLINSLLLQLSFMILLLNIVSFLVRCNHKNIKLTKSQRNY